MPKLQLTRAMAATPEYLFAFFAPQRMPYWYGAEMESCFEVQDGAPEFSLGLKVRISGRLAGKTVSHTAVVTAFERPHLLEWRFADAYGVRGLERWELQPISDESGLGTRLHFWNEFATPGRLGPVIDRLLTRHALQRRNRDYLDRLARLAERRA